MHSPHHENHLWMKIRFISHAKEIRMQVNAAVYGYSTIVRDCNAKRQQQKLFGVGTCHTFNDKVSCSAGT